jgi:N utilization substance protein B
VSARSKARKRALDVLFSAELRGESPVEALQRVTTDGPAPTNDYTGVLVRGVAEHQARIDALLSQYSKDWTLERMPTVDRNVLRLGVYELVWAEDVPDQVAVSEATELVRELSTDDSPTFVSGLLSAILRDKATLEV